MYNNNKKWTQDKGRKRTSDDGPDLQQTRPQHDLIDQIMKQLEGAQKTRAKIQPNNTQTAPNKGERRKTMKKPYMRTLITHNSGVRTNQTDHCHLYTGCLFETFIKTVN